MNTALRFQLAGTDFERTATLPPGLNLFALHDIVQLLFGFDDIYEWGFFDSDKNLYRLEAVEGGRLRGFRTYDATRHTVGEILPAPGDAITYRYGIKEDWTVTVTRQTDPDGEAIACTHVHGPNAIDEFDGPRDMLPFLENLRTCKLESEDDTSHHRPEDDDILDLGLGDPADRETFLAGPDPAKLTEELRKTVLEHLEAAARVALFKNAKANSPCPCGSGQKYKDCCRGKYDRYGFPYPPEEEEEEEDEFWGEDAWAKGTWDDVKEDDWEDGEEEDEDGEEEDSAPAVPVDLSRMIKLKMELLDTRSKRIVTVPDGISFYDLHKVVQKMFGFDDDHLWLFRDGKTDTEYGCDVTPWEYGGRYGPDPFEHAIAETFRAPKDTAKYWYDFGDDWFVRITRMADPKEGPPACLESTGTNAIDDIGGPWALNEFIERLEELERKGAGDIDEDDPDVESYWGYETREDRRAFLAGPAKEELSSWLESESGVWQAASDARLQAAARRKLYKNAGRNDPCPCGSGRKYKNCCLGKYDANGYPVDDTSD